MLSKVLISVALLLTVVNPTAIAQTSQLKDFYFRASNSAVNTRDLFQWPMTTDIDAVLKIDAPAAAMSNVFIVIFEAGEVVAKYKGKHALVAGSNELRLPKLFATDRILGQRLLTAQLELAVKGFPVEKREVAFEVKGPPQPQAEIIGLRLYHPNPSGDPESNKNVHQFELGKAFQVEVLFSVLDNPARLKPRLILLASVLEDDTYTGYDLPRQMYDDHYDMREIELETGEGLRRVIARGSLPHFYASPWQNRHPFRIYAALDFSGGPRVTQYVEAEVFDYTPSEARRDDDPARRLIQLARAQSWNVGEPAKPMDGRPEPVQ